jgi:hypothetical protein
MFQVILSPDDQEAAQPAVAEELGQGQGQGYPAGPPPPNF